MINLHPEWSGATKLENFTPRLEKMFKCHQCKNEFISKDTLDTHMMKEHTEEIPCQECDHISKTPNNMKEHVIENHTIEQLDGSSELQKSPEKINHDELWCYKCEEQQDDCQGWEHQLPNRPAMKAHMHNEHNISIFEDIDIDKHGGFKYYRYPGKFYGY